VKAHSVNGVMPTLETIASGQYPISRSMFIYVKKQHVGVTPGLEQFVMEFMSEAAAGRGGTTRAGAAATALGRASARGHAG